MLNCALIGIGGLGKGCHLPYLVKREEFNLVALCDVRKETLFSQEKINLDVEEFSFNPEDYNFYTDYKEMIEKEDLDLVVIVVPTFLHAEMTIYALNHGINVFCEKPMALTEEETQAMIDAAEKNGKQLMIGQVLRFFEEYNVLKELVDSKKYGEVIKAEFTRCSSKPLWGWENWYLDEKLSGGAALDLHVHDVDMVNWLFGKPNAVASSRTDCFAKYESITTRYIYDDNKVVTTVGDWGYPSKFGFKAGYRVRFEEAALIYEDGKIFLITDDEKTDLTPKNPIDPYCEEVAEFVRCIEANKTCQKNLAIDSALSLKIAIAEKKSAELKQIVEI